MSGLRRETADAKLRLLVERLPRVPFLRAREVWAFGSHAKGKARPGDVDALVVGTVDDAAWEAHWEEEVRRNPPRSTRDMYRTGFESQATLLLKRGGGLHRMDICFELRHLDATRLKARLFVMVWSAEGSRPVGERVLLPPKTPHRRRVPTESPPA